MHEQLLQPGDCLIGYEGSDELDHVPSGLMNLLTAIIAVQNQAIHKLENRIAATESDLANQKSLIMSETRIRKVVITGLQ